MRGEHLPRYQPLADLFETFDELGAAVAVIVDDEVVVDLHRGFADPSRTEVWDERTLANVWSTTKGLTALCVHLAIERGILEVEAPLARWWPEIRDERITVGSVLGHRSGLAAWGTPMTIADLCDWETAVERLAATEPWWEPGSASGYHAVTFGFLLGEVLRRADGRPIGRFLADEVTGPLDADAHIGLSEADLARCATLERDAVEAPPPEELYATAHPVMGAAMTNPLLRDPEVACTTAWRRAAIPSANGHATALGLARVFAAAASGAFGDVERLRRPQPTGVDLVTGPVMDGEPMTWGLGFAINDRGVLGPNPGAFGHGGYGGSLAIADPEYHMGFAYVMNRMTPSLVDDRRAIDLLDATYGCLLAG